MDLEYAYLPIVKVDKNDDGTIDVFGKASGPDLDADKQICDPAWLAKAMPNWFETGANIREMHQPIAAGIGSELAQDGDDGWWLKSTVVDPGSVKKVDAKVLTGYSIGIKSPQIVKDAAAPGGRIVGGDIVEVSLVDRPANQTCKLALAKAVGIGDAITVPEGGVIGDIFDEKRKLLKVETLEETPDKNTVTIKVKADTTELDEAIVKAKELAALGKVTQPTRLLEALTKAVEGDTVKADEMPLIRQAVDAIAQLIQLEAAELPEDSSEVWDISTLVTALYALRDFWFAEAATGEVPDPVTDAQNQELEEEVMEITLSMVADLTKAAMADDASDADKAAFGEITKAVLGGIEPAALLKVLGVPEDAQLVTTDDLMKATKPLEGELAKVKQLAAPGPVRTRSNADNATEARSSLKMVIEENRTKADLTDDPDLKKGYAKLADDAERELRASDLKE